MQKESSLSGSCSSDSSSSSSAAKRYTISLNQNSTCLQIILYSNGHLLQFNHPSSSRRDDIIISRQTSFRPSFIVPCPSSALACPVLSCSRIINQQIWHLINPLITTQIRDNFKYHSLPIIHVVVLVVSSTDTSATRLLHPVLMMMITATTSREELT